MRRLSYAILIVGLAALAACGRSTELQNIENAPLNGPPDVTIDQVTNAILQAGAARDWSMVQRAPGHITATVAPRTHVATVDITYDTETFSIIYVDSTNLHYDGTNIHSNYMSWIKNLQTDIQRNMIALRQASG